MSADATTTDDFRVGRRVRVTNPLSSWHHLECQIIDSDIGHRRWLVQRDNGEEPGVLSESDMVLLPDDEPDAPATPELKFKPKDRVSSIAGSYKGWYGTVIATNGKGYHVVFDCGSNAWKPAGELEACATPEATPEPASADDPVNHPSHYNSSPARCSKCGHPIECIDVVRHMGFNVGNVVKYLWRFLFKGATVQDLEKARWYLEDEIAQRKRGGRVERAEGL